MRRLAIVHLRMYEIWPESLPYHVVGRKDDNMVKIEGDDLPPAEECGRVYQFSTLDDFHAYRRRRG